MRLLLAAAFTVSCLATALASPPPDPRSILLIDQRGKPFRLAGLNGRPTLVTFVATRCSDACPIANVAFAKLEHQLRHDGIDARLLTITLDPDYDTAFVMARFAQTFGAAPRDWTFASGRPANVRRLLRSFGVAVTKDKRGIPDVHSSLVYVLDGNVRLARTLLLSTGLTREAEEALHDKAIAKH